MFGRKPKAPPPPELPKPPPYWRQLELLADGQLRRQTFEHDLPNGGVLVLVRYGDAQSESCAVCYVPPMPRPPGPALRSEPWESGVARESTK